MSQYPINSQDSSDEFRVDLGEFVRCAMGDAITAAPVVSNRGLKQHFSARGKSVCEQTQNGLLGIACEPTNLV
jgi:hypothetical protein